MNLPPKPEFINLSPREVLSAFGADSEIITKKDFNYWYDKVFRDAVMVYRGIREWNHWSEKTNVDQTEIALLIRITPIVKDTIEQEIIRSMVEYIEGDYPRMESTEHGNHSNELIRKARAYLESKK